MKAALLLLVAALVAVASAWERSYAGYTIQRCPTDAEEMKDLVYGIIHATKTDIMADMVGAVEILVTPKLHDVFTGLRCKVVVTDVQELIDLEQAELALSRAAYQRNMNDSDAYHQTYHRYGEIVSKLQEIAKLYPTVATYGTYGTSIEGRALPLIRLKGTSAGAKKTIYINGGIHAREWISPATNVYIIQRLAEQYGKDTEVTRLLNAIEFVFTPVSNPDGYEYTHTSDRLWRKNRNNNAGATCKGVDLNRNFDVYWGTGSSSSKCAEDYHGASAASEPEVKAIQTLVTGLANKIGAIDIHSYGQYIMRPYGWTNTRHPQEATLKVLGDGIVAAIRGVNGVSYSSIRSAELYPVSGASDDWFTVELDLWGFCFELRDNGRYGFRLPESQILPTGQEIFVAILSYADFVLENFSK